MTEEFQVLDTEVKIGLRRRTVPILPGVKIKRPQAGEVVIPPVGRRVHGQHDVCGVLEEVNAISLLQGGDPPLDVGADSVVNDGGLGGSGGGEALGGEDAVCEESTRPDDARGMKKPPRQTGELVLGDHGLLQPVLEGVEELGELVEWEGDGVGLEVKLHTKSHADGGWWDDMILGGRHFKTKTLAQGFKGFKLKCGKEIRCNRNGVIQINVALEVTTPTVTNTRTENTRIISTRMWRNFCAESVENRPRNSLCV